MQAPRDKQRTDGALLPPIAPAASLPEFQSPDQRFLVELPPEMLMVVRANMEQITRLSQAAEAAQQLLATAQQGNMRVVFALIRLAKKDVADFPNMQLWEDPATGRVYMRGMTNDEFRAAMR